MHSSLWSWGGLVYLVGDFDEDEDRELTCEEGNVEIAVSLDEVIEEALDYKCGV